MKYSIGDKFVLKGIECSVALIDALGRAYLVPEIDGEDYNNSPTRVGLVFAILDERGLDKQGTKAAVVVNQECGAV